MAVSQKVRRFMEEGGWIRRVFEEGMALKAQIGADKVFDLSLGNPVMEPPQEFHDELRRLDEDPPGELSPDDLLGRVAGALHRAHDRIGEIVDDEALGGADMHSRISGIGLTGIQKGYELPPPTEDDVWALTDTERRALGYELLPQNLTEALDVMEKSELVAEYLGEHVFDFFLRNKRAEWDAYRRNVTPHELATYLPVL